MGCFEIFKRQHENQDKERKRKKEKKIPSAPNWKVVWNTRRLIMETQIRQLGLF
jgi:hypothetical protein